VRFAEISEPSSSATGRPVSSSLSTITELARASPDSMLPGKEAIHFIPAAGCSPPTKAGNPMIRLRSSPGKRRNVECGTADRPSSCSS
jgi:hypothetical protein